MCPRIIKQHMDGAREDLGQAMFDSGIPVQVRCSMTVTRTWVGPDHRDSKR